MSIFFSPFSTLARNGCPFVNLSGGQILPILIKRPKRVVDFGQERLVTLKFFGRGRMGPSRARRARRSDWAPSFSRVRRGLGQCMSRLCKAKANLSATCQLNIHLRQKLGVEQRPVLNPVRAINPKPRAQRIKAMLGAGKFAARQGQRVNHPGRCNIWPVDAGQLVIQKGKVK
jgi:hypothetical protein